MAARPEPKWWMIALYDATGAIMSAFSPPGSLVTGGVIWMVALVVRSRYGYIETPFSILATLAWSMVVVYPVGVVVTLVCFGGMGVLEEYVAQHAAKNENPATMKYRNRPDHGKD